MCSCRNCQKMELTSTRLTLTGRNCSNSYSRYVNVFCRTFGNISSGSKRTLSQFLISSQFNLFPTKLCRSERLLTILLLSQTHSCRENYPNWCWKTIRHTHESCSVWWICSKRCKQLISSASMEDGTNLSILSEFLTFCSEACLGQFHFRTCLPSQIISSFRRQLAIAKDDFTAKSLGLLANYRKRQQLVSMMESLHTIKTLVSL